jgi:hypothetical protein
MSHEGVFSVRTASPTRNQAAWLQTINLAPERNYLFSGWIKTENVAHALHSGEWIDSGAHLSVWGTTVSVTPRSAALIGTNDWTYRSVTFNSLATGKVTLAAELGNPYGHTKGTAWFDDLRLREISEDDPHPRWKVLVLIYDRVDFAYTDYSGIRHHYLGHIRSEVVTAAAANATRFVTNDIPLLTSGKMVPELTIRYPGTLRRLTRDGPDGFWPSPEDTVKMRDPAFDSVIVIWQPSVREVETGEKLWIGSAAGLTPSMKTGQTYTTLVIEAATSYGHLNVFKHEFGHSLLSFYDAKKTAPQPAVNNHTDATTYVHCGTGEPYVWEDETDANPIPNSIYNNYSGFTHDYYSGTTALASDPLRCLGITAVAWATGGPVSVPGEPEQ